MMNSGSSELIEYRRELSNIISELKNIEGHILRDFQNVGNVQCADSIQSVITKYESALRTLNSIDASLLDQLKQAAIEAATALTD